MIADILIGVIYLLIARYVAFKSKIKFNLFTFSILAVIIQLIFDFWFYIFYGSPKKYKSYVRFV